MHDPTPHSPWQLQPPRRWPHYRMPPERLLWALALVAGVVLARWWP